MPLSSSVEVNFGKIVGLCSMVNGEVEVLETTEAHDPNDHYALWVPGTWPFYVPAVIGPNSMGREIDNAEKLFLSPIIE